MDGRNAQRERFDQRPDEPDDEEDDAADQHHVHAGNRQQVGKAGQAKRFGIVWRNEAAVTGNHRGRHAAAFGSRRRVDESPPARAARRPARRTRRPAAMRAAASASGSQVADRKADAAQLLEPGIAMKLIVAGHDGSRRRRQDRATRDRPAGRQAQLALEAEPDIFGCLIRRQALRWRAHRSRTRRLRSLASISTIVPSTRTGPICSFRMGAANQLGADLARDRADAEAGHEGDGERQQPPTAPPDQHPEQGWDQRRQPPATPSWARQGPPCRPQPPAPARAAAGAASAGPGWRWRRSGTWPRLASEGVDVVFRARAPLAGRPDHNCAGTR